jgi:hypothetical protein
MLMYTNSLMARIFAVRALRVIATMNQKVNKATTLLLSRAQVVKESSYY